MAADEKPQSGAQTEAAAEAWGRLAPPLAGDVAPARVLPIVAGGPIERRRLTPGDGYVRLSLLAAHAGAAEAGRRRRVGAGAPAAFAFIGAEIEDAAGAAARPVAAGLRVDWAALTSDDAAETLDPPPQGHPTGPVFALTGALRVEAALSAAQSPGAARAALVGADRAAAAFAASEAGSADLLGAARAGVAALLADGSAATLLHRRERFDPLFAGCYAFVAPPLGGRRAPMIAGPLSFEDLAAAGDAGGALRNADDTALPGPWMVVSVEFLKRRPGVAALSGPAGAWEALASAVRTGLAADPLLGRREPATRVALESLQRRYLDVVRHCQALSQEDRRALIGMAGLVWRARAPALFATGAEGASGDLARPGEWPSHAALCADAFGGGVWRGGVWTGAAEQSGGALAAEGDGAQEAAAAAADVVAAVARGATDAPTAAAVAAASEGAAIVDAPAQATAGLLRVLLAGGAAEPARSGAVEALFGAGRLDLAAAFSEALRTAGLETADSAFDRADALVALEPGAAAARAALSAARRRAETERRAADHAPESLARDVETADAPGAGADPAEARPWPTADSALAARRRAARRREAAVWTLVARAETHRLIRQLTPDAGAPGADRGVAALLGPEMGPDDAARLLDRALAAYERAAELVEGDDPEQRRADEERAGRAGAATPLRERVDDAHHAEALSLLALAARRRIGETAPRRVAALATALLRRFERDAAPSRRDALGAAGRLRGLEDALVALLALSRSADAVRAAMALAAAAAQSPPTLTRAAALLAGLWDRRGADPVALPLTVARLANAPVGDLAVADAKALRARLSDAREDGDDAEAPRSAPRRTGLMSRLFARSAPAAPTGLESVSATDRASARAAAETAERVLARAALVGEIWWGARQIGAGIALPTRLASARAPETLGPWLFLTCAHVVSPDRPGDLAAAPPAESRVRFGLLGQTLGVRDVAWRSDAHDGHDVIALILDAALDADPLEAGVDLAADAPPGPGATVTIVGPSGATDRLQEATAGGRLAWSAQRVVATASLGRSGEPAGAAGRLQYRGAAAAPTDLAPWPGAPIFAGPSLDLLGLHRLGPEDRLRGRLATTLGAGADWAGVGEGVRLAPALRALGRALEGGAATGLAEPAAPAPMSWRSPAAAAVAGLGVGYAAADFKRFAAMTDGPAPQGETPRASGEAVALIVDDAVGGRSGYERAFAAPVWPGGAAGVTIGIGYDLGWRAAERIEADWTGHVDPVDLALLRTAAGRTPDADGAETVRRLADALRAVEVTWEAAVAVFRRASLPRIEAVAAEIFPTQAPLHPHAFGALTALVADLGPSADFSAIARLLADGQPDRVAGEIRRLAPPADALGAAARARRRAREAELFERGLALGRAAADPDAPIGDAAAGGALEPSEHPDADLVERLGAAAREPEDGYLGLSDRIGAPTTAGAAPALIGTDAIRGPKAAWLAAGAPSVRSAAEADDIDLAHLTDTPLEDAADDAPGFVLTAPLLARALRLVGVDVDALIADASPRNGREPPIILFGLRGAVAEIGEDSAERAAFVDAVRLREATPDFKRLSCTIGVWRPDLARVWAGPGSTVPAAPLVFERAAAIAGGADPAATRLCNLLPTGVYRYRVGTHGPDLPTPQPAAFTPDESHLAVLRADQRDPLRFTIRSRWDLSGAPVADDIHAAGYAGAPETAFLSAGGQVLRGTYVARAQAPPGPRILVDQRAPHQPTDAFGLFRLMAGLAHPIEADGPSAPSGPAASAAGAAAEAARRYPYALLTGRELRIAAALGPEAEADPRLLSLKRGASGGKVAGLQRALGLAEAQIDGRFGFVTQAALIRRQFDIDGAASGVVGPRLLRALGLDAL